MINLYKLTNVVRKEGKTEARCPACAASSADSTGNHLIIFPDGKFGCVAYPGDKEHNRLIFNLAGARGPTSLPEISIDRLKVPESTVLMRIGRIGHQTTNHESTYVQPPTETDAIKSTSSTSGSNQSAVDDYPPAPPGGWKVIDSITVDPD